MLARIPNSWCPYRQGNEAQTNTRTPYDGWPAISRRKYTQGKRVYWSAVLGSIAFRSVARPDMMAGE